MVTARIVDDEFRNLGPTRNSIKQAKKRSKLARANSALEQRVLETKIVTAPPIRTVHKNFEALSDKALQKVSQQAKQLIGQQYRENNNVSTVGTVSTIVRHIKSRRLYFQTWNHEQCITSLIAERHSLHQRVTCYPKLFVEPKQRNAEYKLARGQCIRTRPI